MEILRVAASGQTLIKADTGVGYWIEGTLMGVHLPRPLAPHDSVDIDVAWNFQVPPDGAPREGTTGDVFMVAYWYPQLAVYDAHRKDVPLIVTHRGPRAARPAVLTRTGVTVGRNLAAVDGTAVRVAKATARSFFGALSGSGERLAAGVESACCSYAFQRCTDSS